MVYKCETAHEEFHTANITHKLYIETQYPLHFYLFFRVPQKAAQPNEAIPFLRLANDDGESCYANSLFQVLARLTRLKAAVSQEPNPTDICQELSHLFTAHEQPPPQSLDFSHLRQMIGIQFAAGQQDVDEFWKALVQKLPQSAQCLFQFTEQTQLQCQTCSFLKALQQQVSEQLVTCPAADTSTFKSLFTSDPVQVECEGICQRNTYHLKTSNVQSGLQHKYFVMMLNLFQQGPPVPGSQVPSFHRKQDRKITGFTANNVRIGGSTFRAVGAIAHQGQSPDSGHYSAWVRHQNKWLLINDDKLMKTQARFLSNLKDVYLLVLEKQ